MKDIAKKYGITILGAGFMFLAFIYFLKLAVDLNWIPPVGRAALGLVIGVTGLFVGYTQYLAKRKTIGEICAGLGTSVLYATFAYASFSPDIQWSANALLISMMGLSSLVIAVGYRMNMRMLVFISLLGGLLTPVIIKANPEQDLLLFAYVLILNISALWLSATKKWQELRLMSFLLTMAIFISYYFYFEPEQWVKPMFYATSFFMVYIIGLLSASWHESKRFEGLNLYLGLLNAINYVFWSIYILDSFSLPYALPTMLVGLIFIAAGFVMYRLNGKSMLPVGAYAVLGIIVIAISAGDMGIMFQTNGMNFVMSAGVWLLLGTLVYATGYLVKSQNIRYAAMAVWSLVVVYWYSVAWDVQWVEWFGVKYIPFINPGALIWIAIALVGFTYSKLIVKQSDIGSEELNRHLSTAIAILSHIVLGGLFTVQIDNLWEAYRIGRDNLGLVMSISWFVYAFTLFIWGAYSSNVIFRWMGYIVIGLSTLKVLFIDLSGDASMYKVVALLVVGGITMAIGYVNKIWVDKGEMKNEEKLAA